MSRRGFRYAMATTGGLVLAFAVMTVAARGNTRGWLVVDDVGQAVAAATAAAACAFAARRHRGRLRVVWSLFALGSGLWCAGQVTWASWEIPRGTPPPTAWFSDLGFLGASLCFTAAVVVLVDSAARRLTRVRALVESVLVAASLLYASWVVVLHRVYVQPDLTIAQRVVTLAYPAFDVIVISVLLFALSRVEGPGRRLIAGLGASVGVMAIADSTYAYMSNSPGGYVGVQPHQAAWVAGLLVLALVAIVAKSPLEGSAAPSPMDASRGRVLLAVPSLSAIVVVIAFAVQRAIGASVDPVEAWIAMVVLTLTVLQNVTVIFENHALSAHLASARDEAISGSRMKSEFLANMSHEIRTPMNAVIGLTALLLETVLDDTQREFAEGVAISAEGLLGIINDILDFSKIEAGKITLESTDLDLEDLVHEVATIVVDAARRKSLELVVYCEPGLPTHRRGDPVRLRQILLNLAANAIKFTAEGHVVIRALSCPDRPDHVRFEVVDSGIGIAPADQDRLFDPFSQADASTTRKFGGTGLGLTIVLRLTELQGGTVTLQSEENVGTTFEVTVPLPMVSQPSAEAALDSLVGLTALVVDDNAVNRLVLTHALRSWGFVVDEAASPAEGIELFGTARSSSSGYALALLDYQMPGMNGIDLARTLRREHPDATTTMLLLSSASEVSRPDAQEAGIASIMVKPVRNADLLRRIMTASFYQQGAEPVGVHQ
jgi:two-component system sensor histidine kinase/response regulator